MPFRDFLNSITPIKWYDFFIDVFLLLFVLLFVYTASSKLFEFDAFKRSIHAQPLAGWLKDTIIYSIPPLELIIAVLIMFPRTKLWGVIAFATMMILFTGYTALVTVNYYAKQPCSCGGVFRYLTWKEHLLLNSVFLIAAIISVIKLGRENKNKTFKETISFS
ncbi:Methylamine utilisation protein MauE [Chitinophaga costaii]|uniref:Methylamine utilisation protein MauE n=1 Tax=Chitinophaga costaii TaxID=1335309 RepID=A0A1C3YQQ6_9BACT|nr:hypothetical protein DCM91_00830 [Chitinophaga costaii]SCB72382.1 Methylamine utilisation protein MauE [Chitinophaga costaii]